MCLGEKPSNVDQFIRKLASTLQGEMPKFRTVVLDFIFKCVLNLPPKIPIYSTLVGLMHANDGTIGTEVIDRVVEELQVALRHNEMLNVKILVRFAADLVNARVVEGASIFPLFDKLLADGKDKPFSKSANLD